jgi:hypothetical protein
MLCWGLANVHVTQTVLAVGQQWMANLMMLWPQDKHQTMYAISLLEHVVVLLSTSEGSQKWFAPCGTDVHGVAYTIDVCIVEQESQRQTKMIMWNGALRAHNMENLGATSVCLLEQLWPLFLAQTVVTIYSPPSFNRSPMSPPLATRLTWGPDKRVQVQPFAEPSCLI